MHDAAFFRLPLGERIEALLAEAAVIDQEDLVSRLPLVREDVLDGRDWVSDIDLGAELLAQLSPNRVGSQLLEIDRAAE